MPSLPPVLRAAGELALVSIGLNLSIYAYHLVVDPLYGSAAISKYLEHVVLAATVLSLFVTAQPRWMLSALGCLLFFAPVTGYWCAAWTSRLEAEIKGPLACHVLVVAPIVTLTLASAKGLRAFAAPVVGKHVSVVVGTLISLAGVKFLSNYRLVTPGDVITFIRIFQGLAITATALCIAHAKNTLPPASPPARPAKSKKKSAKPEPESNANAKGLPGFLPDVLPLVALLLATQVYPFRQVQLPWTDPKNEVRLLASKSSVTGRIVVAEHLEMGFRYLRADHSLLGGQWIDLPTRRGETGDSIYTAFMLQEAARLVETGPKNTALIVGLGIGVSANTFMRVGMNTTIVEIDPVVYDYAREYFGLRTPDSVHFADARSWVQKQGALATPPKYDVIIHDCFSGGGVPSHLYTIEFWNDLKKIISDDGVVAANYFGVLGSDTGRAILATMLEVFPQCRTFHDSVSREQQENKARNMVFFCTPSRKPMTFRSVETHDIQNSQMRRQLFSAWSTLEIPTYQVFEGEDATQATDAFNRKDWVLTDAKNPLGAWQDADALHHWHLMRYVLPAVHWEAF